jgi:CheY-like chemotaxis protein
MKLEQTTILLAEDETNDVFFMQRCFEKARLLNPLQVVNDGVQAMAYLKGEGEYADREKFPFPILMLLDLRMPRKSGFEVLEWRASQPGLKRLPTVVLTSSKEGPDINRAYDLGANSYLVKPPQPEALAEMFQRLNSYWVALNVPPDCAPNGNG